ncbi:MAG: endolytic transglycosylase MltG [Micrococcales bacterium]|nr:endolytic transglycosylase MltG [Micrococcales bacterium]
MTQDQLSSEIFGDGGAPRDRTGRQRRPRRERGGPSLLRRLLVLGLAACLIGGGVFLGYSMVRPVIDKMTASKDFSGPGTGAVSFQVKEGESGGAIASRLTEAGVIKSSEAFVKAAAANPKQANAIQPGTYKLKKEMKAADAIAVLADPKQRSVPRVTIPEGLWASEIYTRLAKATGHPVADYTAAAKDTAALGLPASAKGNVEGYLFPSTYEFGKDTPAAAQLKAMVAKSKAVLAESGLPEAQWERAVVIASIVEAEAKGEADRPKVARVIINREQNKGAPNYGLLQFDSTVSYGVKRRGVTTTDAERKDDNPYNTYVHPGLPAGPISNPGEKSLKAGAQPANGPWLFFVAVNPISGETKFATTTGEHQKNVLEFQRWCQAHPGVCN